MGAQHQNEPKTNEPEGRNNVFLDVLHQINLATRRPVNTIFDGYIPPLNTKVSRQDNTQSFKTKSNWSSQPKKEFPVCNEHQDQLGGVLQHAIDKHVTVCTS